MPFDGSEPVIQDYYRGDGFYDINQKNIKKITSSNVQLAIITIITKRNAADLNGIANALSQIGNIRYWLISEFRRINPIAQNVEDDIYAINNLNVEKIIDNIRQKFCNLNIFYLRSREDSFPPRLWCDLSGRVYTDLSKADNNLLLGSLEDNLLNFFIQKMYILKSNEKKHE